MDTNSCNLDKQYSDFWRYWESITNYISSLIDQALKLSVSDPLRTEVAITLASRLRVLLHDSDNNRSLSYRLGLKSEFYFQVQKSCNTLDNLPSNMVFSSVLTSIMISGNNVYCKANAFEPSEDILYTFDAWWNEIVIDSKYAESSHVTRRDIILTLANKEGGAHVDGKYPQSYYQVQFGNGFCLLLPSGEEKFISNNVYAESVLVIAQEFLNAWLIYRNLRPNTFSITPSKYKILQLTYYQDHPKGVQKRYRFMRYRHGELEKSIMLLFDYYHPASYHLLDLFQISKVFNIGDILYAMVVDLSSPSHQIVYARTDNCEIHRVLLKCNSGYKVFESENSMDSSEQCKSLDEVLAELSPMSPSLFKQFLDKQVIDICSI